MILSFYHDLYIDSPADDNDICIDRRGIVTHIGIGIYCHSAL